MKLLFAEDDPDVARGVAAILERNNYLVDVVNNGQDAYDYIMEGDYDAAVLDIMMPKMNGDEVVRRIRKNGKSIPVMLLTAMGEVEDRIDGLDAGADDYLTKPFVSGELLRRHFFLQRCFCALRGSLYRQIRSWITSGGGTARRRSMSSG